MTDAQLKVKCVQLSDERHYEYRAFRKKCVTLGIVQFVRKINSLYYEMYYRGRYVCTLFKSGEEYFKLFAVWNTIEIAEDTIKKIEGVINDKCTMESQMCTVI